MRATPRNPASASRHGRAANTSIPWVAGQAGGGSASAATSPAASTARDEFDRMTAGGHVGPRWLIGRASEASVLASARQSWLSDEEDWRDLGIRVEGRHRLNRRTTALPQRRPARAPLRGARPSRRPGDGHLHRHRLGRHPHRAPGRRPRAGESREPSASASATPTAGCGSERRSCSRGASPSAARPRCAGPNTRGTGRRSSSAAARAATSPARSASTSTTAASPWAGSARRCPCCRRKEPPTPNCMTTRKFPASFASSGCSDTPFPAGLRWTAILLIPPEAPGVPSDAGGSPSHWIIPDGQPRRGVTALHSTMVRPPGLSHCSPNNLRSMPPV